MNTQNQARPESAVELPVSEVLGSLRIRLARIDDAITDVIATAYRCNTSDALTAALDALVDLRYASDELSELEGYLAPEEADDV